MAHVPFERMTPERRALIDNRDWVATQMIGRNRRARRQHERLAQPGRDRMGNYYCIRHQVKLRRCPFGFYCPVRFCPCTFQPKVICAGGTGLMLVPPAFLGVCSVAAHCSGSRVALS